MTEAVPLLGTFHADAIQEFKQEFPGWAPTVDRLVSEGKIVIVDQKVGVVNVNSNNSKNR